VWKYGAKITVNSTKSDIAYSGKETGPPEDPNVLFGVQISNAFGANDVTVYFSETSDGSETEVGVPVGTIKSFDNWTWDQVKYVKAKTVSGSEEINLIVWAHPIPVIVINQQILDMETLIALARRTNTLLEMLLKKGYKAGPR
jgi:hypothetical protein